jgi:hypothetical protein
VYVCVCARMCACMRVCVRDIGRQCLGGTAVSQLEYKQANLYSHRLWGG